MRNLGPTEILLVLALVLLLFGAKKLPELARGSGKAIRIFKTEIEELRESDVESSADLDLSGPVTAAEADHA